MIREPFFFATERMGERESWRFFPFDSIAYTELLIQIYHSKNDPNQLQLVIVLFYEFPANMLL